VAEQPYQQVPDGNGAKQIGDSENDQACEEHVESEFSTCGAADALARQET
jgi:hypothetical protein